MRCEVVAERAADSDSRLAGGALEALIGADDETDVDTRGGMSSGELHVGSEHPVTTESERIAEEDDDA